MPAAGGLLVAGVLTLPFPVLDNPLDLLDDSWQLGLSLAHRSGLPWGSQIIWTYGPYGWLLPTQPWFADQWLASFAVLAIAHLFFLFAIGLQLLWTGVGWRLVPGLVVLVPMGLFPTSYLPTIELETAFGSALLIALALDRPALPAVLMAAVAGTVLAFLCLFKGTGLAGGLAVVLVGTAIALPARSPVGMALPLAFLGGGLGLWLAAGQRVDAIGAYLRSTYEVANGYGAALSINPVDLRTVIAIGILVAMAAVAGTAAATRAWPLFRLALVLGPLTLVYFREGFDRYETHHAMIFFSAALIAACLALIGAGRAMTRVPLAAVAAVIAVVMVGGAGPLVDAAHEHEHAYRLAVTAAVNPTDRGARVDAVVEEIRARYMLPPEMLDQLRSGSVDVVPWDIATVRAYDLRWDPRPVLQSYSAYTPYLDAADAAHFRGPRSPDHVLYRYAAIDGRYPLFDEPQAFRALLENYKVSAASGAWLVLERRPQPLADDLQPAGRTCAASGVPVSVPRIPGRLVYASIDVPYSALGRLGLLAFKIPPPTIRLHLADGSDSGTFRLVQAVAPDGLLVSHYEAAVGDVAALFAGQPNNPVGQVMAGGDGPAYTGVTCYRFLSAPSSG